MNALAPDTSNPCRPARASRWLVEIVASPWTGDPTVRLRRALKMLRRSHGLRCSSVVVLPSSADEPRLTARTVRSVVNEHPPGTRLPVDLVALPAGWRMVRPALVERTAGEAAEPANGLQLQESGP